MSEANNISAMTRKPITRENAEAASRLRAIWNEKKRELHLTQERAAEVLGFSTQGAVSQYLNGKAPLNTDATLKFARLLGVSPADIRPELSELMPAEDGALTTRHGSDQSDEKSVVVGLFNARGSMGNGFPLPERDTIVDVIHLSRDWVASNLPNATNPKNLAALTAYGDSMTPTFTDGDILLVDRGVSDLKADAVYVLSLNGELFIKRIQRRITDGAVIVKSDNQFYDPIVVNSEEKSEIQVLGRVVWAWCGKKL